MMFHVKWFFLAPCLINYGLAICFGAAAGNAISIGDWARTLVLLAVTALFWANAAACGMMATRP